VTADSNSPISTDSDNTEIDELLEEFRQSIRLYEDSEAELPATLSQGENPARPGLDKVAVAWALAVYIAAAIALHTSNFLTTHDPKFDPHQFITDEFGAIVLAPAVTAARGSFRKRQ
jgi:hypothetical protein